MADPGEWDWLSGLTDLGGDVGDLADFGDTSLYFDTDTGMFVDPGAFDPASVTDFNVLDDGGIPSDPYPMGPQDVIGSQDYDFGDMPNAPLPDSPISRSTSDVLRSMEGAPAGTTAPGREAFDWNAMADPSASIASTGGSNWGKALADGLKAAQGLLGSGSKLLGAGADAGGDAGRAASGVGGLAAYTAPQVGQAGLPQQYNADLAVGRPQGGGGVPVGGLSDLARVGGGGVGSLGVGTQDPVMAALLRLQADPAQILRQGPIEAGPEPKAFTPLALPPAGAPPAGLTAPSQRLSGLQRLALERFG